jgi:hypothetical protein
MLVHGVSIFCLVGTLAGNQTHASLDVSLTLFRTIMLSEATTMLQIPYHAYHDIIMVVRAACSHLKGHSYQVGHCPRPLTTSACVHDVQEIQIYCGLNSIFPEIICQWQAVQSLEP